MLENLKFIKFCTSEFLLYKRFLHEAGTKLAKKEEIDHEKWSISSLNYTKIKYLHL